eukprot:jgi/Hompol1/5341/HPOL_001236-RA
MRPLHAAQLLLAFVALTMCLVPAVYALEHEGDDDVDLDDIDEIQYTPETVVRESVPVTPAPRMQTAMNWKTLSMAELWVEMLMLLIFAIYLAAFVYGKRINRELARKWIRLTIDTWEAHFAHIGSNEGHKLIRDGPQDYIFYASGREYVKHVYGYLCFVARHDIFQWVMDFAQAKNKCDKVTLKFTLQDNIADQFLLAILPKYNVDSILKSRWDLANFPKARDFPGFPKDELSLLTDAPEFAALLWQDPYIRKTLLKSVGRDGKYRTASSMDTIIEEIILSNLPKTNPETIEAFENQPRVLTVTFRLPYVMDAVDDVKEMMNDIIELSMDIIDYIGRFGTLSAEAKAKIHKMHQAAINQILKAKEEKRKEELANKKIAEKKARDEKISQLSAEEQRKYEEKERKRLAKKNRAQMMKHGKAIL